MSRDEVMKLVELIKNYCAVLMRNETGVTSTQYEALVCEIKRKPSRIKYGSIKKDYVMLDDIKITVFKRG